MSFQHPCGQVSTDMLARSLGKYVGLTDPFLAFVEIHLKWKLITLLALFFNTTHHRQSCSLPVSLSLKGYELGTYLSRPISTEQSSVHFMLAFNKYRVSTYEYEDSRWNISNG